MKKFLISLLLGGIFLLPQTNTQLCSEGGGGPTFTLGDGGGPSFISGDGGNGPSLLSGDGGGNPGFISGDGGGPS